MSSIIRISTADNKAIPLESPFIVTVKLSLTPASVLETVNEL